MTSLPLDHATITLIVALTLLIVVSSQGLVLFAFLVFFRYGSSAGSRAKDSVIAGQLAPPAPIPSSAPTSATPPASQQPAPVAPSPVPPPPAASVPTITLTGKMSTFGGPNDTGMQPDEDLALYDSNNESLIAGFLMSEQAASAQAGTTITGLGRRLIPSKLYVACRFDYAKTPKSFLRTVGAHVAANGKTINCRPVDWGPAASTGRIADLSPGAAAALGLQTDDTVTVTIPLPSGAGAVAATPHTSAEAVALPVSGEPAWLTWARREIGQHEDADNTGPVVQRYIDLSHCGAQHDPWCAIFANAALESNGIPGTRSPAAQSFCTDPRFVKLDGPRIGAIAVFWRGTRSSGQGHVGFLASMPAVSATKINVLGGNENDQVEIEPIPVNGSTMGLLGYWWPVSDAQPEPKLV